MTAFLISGIGGTQNIIGQPYVDADGIQYLPMSQQPIMIHSATGEQLQEVLQKAIEKKWLSQFIPKSYLQRTMMKITDQKLQNTRLLLLILLELASEARKTLLTESQKELKCTNEIIPQTTLGCGIIFLCS